MLFLKFVNAYFLNLILNYFIFTLDDLQILTTKVSKCMFNDVDECVASEVQDGDTVLPNQIKRKTLSQIHNEFQRYGKHCKRRCLKNDASNKYSLVGDEIKYQEDQRGSNFEQNVFNCTDIETQNQEQNDEATPKSAAEDANDSNVLSIENDEKKETIIENYSLKPNKVKKVEELDNSAEEANNSNYVLSNENNDQKTTQNESDKNSTFTSVDLEYSMPLNLLSASDSSKDNKIEIRTNKEVGEWSTNEDQHSDSDSEYIKSFVPSSIRFKNSETNSLNNFKKMLKEKLETLTDHQVPEKNLPVKVEEASTSFDRDSEERDMDYTQCTLYYDDIIDDSPIDTEDDEDIEFLNVKHPVDLPNLKQLIFNKRNKSSMQSNIHTVNNDMDNLNSSQQNNDIQGSPMKNASVENDSTSQSEKVDTYEQEIIVDSKIDDKSDNKDGSTLDSISCSSDNSSDYSDSSSTRRNNCEQISESFYESESEESFTLGVSLSESSSEDDQIDMYDQGTIIFGDIYKIDDKIATTSTDVESHKNNQERSYFQTMNEDKNVLLISKLSDEKEVNNYSSISISSADNSREDVSENKTNKSPETSCLKIVENLSTDETGANDDILKLPTEQYAQIDDTAVSMSTNNSQKPFAQGDVQVVNSKHDNEVASTISDNDSNQMFHQSHEKVYHNIEE